MGRMSERLQKAQCHPGQNLPISRLWKYLPSGKPISLPQGISLGWGRHSTDHYKLLVLGDDPYAEES